MARVYVIISKHLFCPSRLKCCPGVFKMKAWPAAIPNVLDVALLLNSTSVTTVAHGSFLHHSVCIVSYLSSQVISTQVSDSDQIIMSQRWKHNICFVKEMLISMLVISNMEYMMNTNFYKQVKEFTTVNTAVWHNCEFRAINKYWQLYVAVEIWTHANCHLVKVNSKEESKGGEGSYSN